MRPLVYLCDLSHIQPDGSYANEVVPYGIACLKAYADDQIAADIRLFKDPRLLEAALVEQVIGFNPDCIGRQSGVPDIVGFSNYLWNHELSCTYARAVKERHPSTWVVFGGPNVPYDTSVLPWMAERPYIDLLVAGPGETAITQITQRLARGLPLSAGVVHGKPGLDRHPSPYLTGCLDAFLADPKLTPLMEGVRGCPYRCTYCVDGTDSPVHAKPASVLIAELRYIAERTQSQTLILADPNFGMYPEDLEFAKGIAQVQQETGYPANIVASTAKNRKDRVLEISEILGGSLRLAASVQSLDPDVLKKVQRKNIPTEELTQMALDTRSGQANTYSELILGLPGDSRQKHIDGILQLVDMGFDQIRMHQLCLLDGSTLATPEQRAEHNLVTHWRVLQRSFGSYEVLGDPTHVTEFEEVVTGGYDFTMEDYLYCRSFALTVALFYNERVFSELADLLRYLNIPYSAFLQYIHAAVLELAVEHPIRHVYHQFQWAAQEELRPSSVQLKGMAINASYQQDLQDGKAGNNLLFNAQGHVLWHNMRDLLEFAFAQVNAFMTLEGLGSHAMYCTWPIDFDTVDYLKELERYLLFKKGHLKNLDITARASFWYDFVEMEANGWEGLPERLLEPITIEFAFEQWQKELFSGLLHQYGLSDQGLGKLIARAPIKHTYRHAERV